MRIYDADMVQVWVDYKTAPTEELRNQLMVKYLPLVRYVAERLAVTLPSFVDVDDLESYGVFGLVDAIERYDFMRGVKFRTYATFRIRGSILDAIRDLDWVPRLVRIKARKIQLACEKLEGRLGRAPTFAEMADELGLDHGEYHSMIEGATATAIISLSEEWTDQEENHGNRKIDLVEDVDPSGSPLYKLQLQSIRETVAGHLTEKERVIVTLYYYEGLSMKEIAKVLRLTESRICQIHGKILERVREALLGRQDDLFVDTAAAEAQAA
jgi:RNA polymerase sigma factor FliA